MGKTKRTAALVLALALLFAAAQAEPWRASKDTVPKFQKLANLLKRNCTEPHRTDRETAETYAEAIRAYSEADGNVADAVVEHWFTAVADPDYPMYVYSGEETAEELEKSGLEFGGKHAFVVLGFRLEDGEITEELKGRCDAAAAAARSFPDAVIVCTGGVTGPNNPESHSEAGEMKKYLTESRGIAAERIYTETESATTGENAENTMRILQELGVESFTVVTSDYHQLWGQIVFSAAAAMSEQETGRAIRLTGNYNYPAQPDTPRTAYCATGMNQLMALIRKGAGLDK